MTRFVQGADRGQSTLLPECLEGWVVNDNPVRVIDAFVDALDLANLGFDIESAASWRPSYLPSTLLKLRIYGYLNWVHSSRRLETEAGRNVEVMWLLARLAPDHKAIADFRKDNGPGIKKFCARFVELCREMELLAKASVAIGGSKFKAVNNRHKNFTRGYVDRRRTQMEESVARYLAQLDTADRQDPSEIIELKKSRIKERLKNLAVEMAKLAAIEKQLLASPDQLFTIFEDCRPACGQTFVVNTHLNLNARRARNVGSPAGSTKTCSNARRRGSIKTQTPCARGARPLSIPPAH